MKLKRNLSNLVQVFKYLDRTLKIPKHYDPDSHNSYYRNIVEILYSDPIFLKHKFNKIFPIDFKSPCSFLNNFSVEKVLGKGAYGTAYLIKKNNKLYACKVIKLNEHSQNEIRIHKLMSKHGIAPKFYTSFVCGTNIIIIMQYMNRGTLTEEYMKNPYIKKEIKRKVIKMHDLGIVHSDLHYGNVLINFENNKLVPYISDFGLSSTITEFIKEVDSIYRTEFKDREYYIINKIAQQFEDLFKMPHPKPSNKILFKYDNIKANEQPDIAIQ